MNGILWTVKLEFIIDTGDFNKYLDVLNVRATNAMKEALYGTGNEMLAAADPKTPIDEGTLIGSASVTVSGNPPVYNDSGKAQSPANVSDMKAMELRVGYNTAYAYKVHEDPFYKDRKGEIKMYKPGPTSVQKGITEWPYKWLTKTINNGTDWGALTEQFFYDYFKRMNM